MSVVRVAKAYRDCLVEFVRDYQGKHPGPVNLKHVATWLLDNDICGLPRRSQVNQLAKELAAAARAKRITDLQGRRVRAMHAVKAERVDANGNRIFDVVWDHIHEMSADHATASFTQRHSNIEKQCVSHNRDVQSFNENNPNARDIQLTFEYIFDHAIEEPGPQVVEKIAESNGEEKPKPR